MSGRPEPCESCGTQVQFLTFPGVEHNNDFFEPIFATATAGEVTAGEAIGGRRHTPERCHAARPVRGTP